jgi:hypothetical protein
MPAPTREAGLANATDTASAVHLLADHLDAILAAGEDMIGLSFDPGAMIANGVPKPTAAAPDMTAEQFVRQISALELSATLRVITARTRAEELMELDNRFDAIARLFVGGTASLVDAATRAGIDASGRSGRVPGTDAVRYLRARGVIGENDAGLPDFDPVTIGETFLLCGTVELGGLMDMTAAFLDALELHFELFPAEDDGAGDVAQAPRLDFEPGPLIAARSIDEAGKLN